jgi:NAD(P)-dependent dehydrogenase (short-subunit alcohol dehydrogenase family)
MTRDWDEESASSGLGLDAAEKLARQSFTLVGLYTLHKREIQAWCDQRKEADLKTAESKLLQSFAHLQQQAKEKLEEEASRLDETKVRQIGEAQQKREAAHPAVDLGQATA